MSASARPNILIFMTDQEQAQVTLPDHPCRTPNLDRIVAQGVRFTHVYPPMAHCCPARASFMTGLYPSQHGVYNNVDNDQAYRRGLKPGVETFSEKLAESGYDLYYSGKWHISAEERPTDRGWKEWLYVTEISKEQGDRRQMFRNKPSERGRTDRKPGELLRPGWGSKQLYGMTTDSYEEMKDYAIVQKGVDQLNKLKDSMDPWCVYIGVNGPHDPFIVPEKYATMYNPDDIKLPPNYHDALTDKPGVYRRMRKVFDQLTEKEVKESIAHYWGYCSMMDDLFGDVLSALEANGQMDNTLILFLSDHGEHAGAHGLYAKGISHFDEGYRVPCMISWPGHIAKPGSSVDEFVTLMDMAPTLIEAAGAAPLVKCSGVSLQPFLRGETPEAWRSVMFTQCNGTEVLYTSRMVKDRKYKFVYSPADIDELYDLENDPHELVNIIDDPSLEHVKEMMYTRMWEQAYLYEDTIFNPYVTVATADYGPAIVNG